MRAMPCGFVREGSSSTTSPSRWMLSPGRTGFSQRRSSTPAPNSGCGPNGFALAAIRMAIAAVCQPDAARPPRMVFFAASSSRWNGCGSYSDAKRMMSSFDTVIASLLKRMPSFRSSNHSIIAPSLTSHIERGRLPQIQFLEKVVPLVVDDDEGREIHPLDAPDRFHAEFGIFHHLDFLDAVLGEICRSTADRSEIEAAVL